MSEEDKSSLIAPDAEPKLPGNTAENPQPSLFRVDKADLYEHHQYVRTFPKNMDVKAPSPGVFQDFTQVNETQDEYIYTKKDPAGEAKISENGYLLGGRKYIITTFTLPGRGKKLFCLGTEAAKLLNNRDAFVLFNRYKQLYKLKCSDEERKFLEDCNFSISRIKSRSVAVTTAKNLFMVFGARIVKNGKRVEDDYWEEDAIEQGFKSSDQVHLSDKAQTIKGESTKPKSFPAKPQPKLPKPSQPLNALPSLEERREYLIASSTGNPSQILPGQSIAGEFELATLAKIPVYKQENLNTTKHRNILVSLAFNSPTSTSSSQTSFNYIPINDKLVGEKSTNGLPYYSSDILKRIQKEDHETIKEIEYLHGTVETNNYISQVRAPRNKQWQYYWQVRSGAPFGLVENQKEAFLKEKEEALNKVHEETIYNEFLYCDQIIKKRRRPNPNYLNHGNIKGLKPPYAVKPVVQVQSEQQTPQVSQGQIVTHLPPQMAHQQTQNVFPPGVTPVQRMPHQGMTGGITPNYGGGMNQFQ